MLIIDRNNSLWEGYAWHIETEIWGAHQDLNLEPTDYESAALTN